MNRSELHAEAIRIHRAMVDAPPGEQVTVLFAALLNFVRPKQTVAKVETLDPAPCLRCCGSGAEPPPGWVGRQPLRIERSADGTLCHTCPWGSTERHADCAACVLEPAVPARPEASIEPVFIHKYPKWCDCGRGRGTPHEAGCVALSEPAGNTGQACDHCGRVEALTPYNLCHICG